MKLDPDWNEVRSLLDRFYEAKDRLEDIFPGRKFTLDGHLVGSIGEVVAAYMFDLDLFRGSNNRHDAVTRDGRHVEVKLTQGSIVAIRHEPAHLIVLRRRRGCAVEVIFNGPGPAAWAAAGTMGANGQRPIGVARLLELDRLVSEDSRLPVVRTSPL